MQIPPRDFLLRLNPGPDSCAHCRATLREVAVGGRAVVAGFDLPEESTRRLLELGFTPGTLLEVIRFAPLGDPVEVRVRGYHLSLRRGDAGGIFVSPEVVR